MRVAATVLLLLLILLLGGCDAAEPAPLPGQTWTLAKDGSAKWALDCDFTGMDLDVKPKTQGQLCSVECQSRPGCTHFAWVSDNLTANKCTKCDVPESQGGCK